MRGPGPRRQRTTQSPIAPTPSSTSATRLVVAAREVAGHAPHQVPRLAAAPARLGVRERQRDRPCATRGSRAPPPPRRAGPPPPASDRRRGRGGTPARPGGSTTSRPFGPRRAAAAGQQRRAAQRDRRRPAGCATSTQAQTAHARASASGYSSASANEPGSARQRDGRRRARRRTGSAPPRRGTPPRSPPPSAPPPTTTGGPSESSDRPEREEGVLAPHDALRVAALRQPLVPRVVPRAQRPQQPVAHGAGHPGGARRRSRSAPVATPRAVKPTTADEPQRPHGQRRADAGSQGLVHRRAP